MYIYDNYQNKLTHLLDQQRVFEMSRPSFVEPMVITPLLKELTKHAKWADGHAFLITLGYFPDSAATAAVTTTVADEETNEEDFDDNNE